MNRHTVLRLLIAMFLVSVLGCAYHLRQEIRNAGPTVVFEQKARYLPNGYSGFLSDNYPGILAIVGDSLYFDCPGRGSRPAMKKITYFSIPLQEIVAIDAQQDAMNGSKILRIFARAGGYSFVVKNPEPFCDALRPLTRVQ